MQNKNVLLDVRNLTTAFQTEHGLAKAVNGVSFQVNKGEVFAIVGESGSGKSVTAQAYLIESMQKKVLLNFYLWLENLALSATKIEAVSINHSHIKLSSLKFKIRRTYQI